MSRYTILAVAAVVSTVGVACLADQNGEQKYSIQFTGEDGKPIPDALFYLYDETGGRFKNALFRGYKLDADAKISLDSLPAEYMMGVRSDGRFYQQWWNGKNQLLKPTFDVYQDVKLAPGHNVVKVEQTGAVSITFAHVDQEIQHQEQNSPVLLYYHRSAKGEYVLRGGIGVWPTVGKAIPIRGLPPGDYKFELKPHPDSNDIFWTLSEVAIRKRAVTHLTNLGALTVR